MPQYIVQRSATILNKFNKALNKANILILGIAYKSDIGDYRESPALKIIENFQKQGSEVKFYDPYISSYMYKGEEHYGIKLTQEVLRNADLVIITTAHKKYNYSFIQENSIFIFDTRNATKNVQNKDNIELL